MQSNRNLLWVVLVGAVAVVAAYTLGTRNATPPPAAAVAPAPAVATAPAADAPRASSAEPSPADLTAAEAEQTFKRLDEEQNSQMTDTLSMMANPPKVRLPADGEWVDTPPEEPARKN